MKATDVQQSQKREAEGHEAQQFETSQLQSFGDMPLAGGPDGAQLKQLQSAANASSQVHQLRTLQAAANNSPQVKATAQLMQAASLFSQPAIQRKENKTGMPDQLKSGIESMSGMAMDDVKVHYNSAAPAQLNAHAYAQGSDIHLAPGQEQHLPHEAWHVVQQRQGRVQPTTEVGGQAVNDNVGLEQEADIMGAKALQAKADPNQSLSKGGAGIGSAQLVAQLYQTGRVDNNKTNKQQALQELGNITINDLNSAMQRLEHLVPGTLDRYKDEYRIYIAGGIKAFLWPLSYINGRGARKNGRVCENGAIANVYGTLSKNNQAYTVHYDRGDYIEECTTIPDYISDTVVGDVKNVKDLSFTPQMRAIYAMSKGFDINGDDIYVTKHNSKEALDIGYRDFDLIVRRDDHQAGATHVSGPLSSAADNIWRTIDN